MSSKFAEPRPKIQSPALSTTSGSTLPETCHLRRLAAVRLQAHGNVDKVETHMGYDEDHEDIPGNFRCRRYPGQRDTKGRSWNLDNSAISPLRFRHTPFQGVFA